MVKLTSRLGRNTGQYLLIATMTSLLVACGGSSSADTAGPFPDLDSDGDEIINSEDDDDDGDSILDVDDLFTDRDLDGFDDTSGLTEEEANAPIAPVVEGDNDNDGFTDVTEATPCGGESGSDNNSADDPWNNNCVVKRATVNGQFARSLYSVGIQRVIYCEGIGDGARYTNFADGVFGAGTEQAVKDFQSAETLAGSPLTDDGVVGPQTWARLQSKLSRLVAGELGDNGGVDTYGFTEGRCADIPLFYQQTQIGADSTSVDGLGWSLARNEPNEALSIEFSISSDLSGL